MNELIICIAFIPIIFLTPGKSKRGVLWLSLVVSLACVGYFVWQRSGDPFWWAPLVSFLALTISEVFERRELRPYTALSALFFAQSLLAQNIEVTIICIVFGDLFLNAETFSSGGLSENNRAIRNISRSILSLLPVTFGVLLHLEGNYFISALALTICLRLFTWPFPHWISQNTGDRFYSNLLISGVSTFALWHGQDFSAYPAWAMVWMLIAAFLSLGSHYVETYIAMVLGVFCISPYYGILGIALLPLLAHKGKGVFILALFVGLGGALICEFSTKVILETSIYVVGAVSALLLTRSFVSAKVVVRPWFADSLDIFLAAISFGAFLYVFPVKIPEVGILGLGFIGVFGLGCVLGRVLYSKRPSVFDPLKPLKTFFISDVRNPPSILSERVGKQIFLGELETLTKYYNALESESHFIWLLGLLGLALIWGLR